MGEFTAAEAGSAGSTLANTCQSQIAVCSAYQTGCDSDLGSKANPEVGGLAHLDGRCSSIIPESIDRVVRRDGNESPLFS